MHGEHPVGDGADRALALRAAQRQACATSNVTKFVPTAQYAVLNGTTYDGIHHYFGRADTVFHIGRALGEGVLELMEEQSSDTTLNSGNVWINEFHYNNSGNDTNAFVEIAHTIPITGYKLLSYRGDSVAINNISLTGTVPHSTVNAIYFTVVEYTSEPGFPTAVPSGCALADPNDQVVEFLSNDGILMTASGIVSTDVGVREDGATPSSYSLQKCPQSHVWTGPLPNTKGQPNTVNCTAILPAEETTQPTHLLTKVLLIVGFCVIFCLAVSFFWSNKRALMKH
jgi:hypothetical protein